MSDPPKLVSAEELVAIASPKAQARIAYGEGPLQFGDLRLPDGADPHPVAVVVHGGCWRAKYDLEHVGAFSDALARAGIATWSIEYRRVGNDGGGWPGTFQDVGTAVDHLREVARDYPLDLDRIVTVGHSAGGHLALWLAARPKLTDSTVRGDDPLEVRGVVSLAAVDDLRRAIDECVCDDMAAQLLGGAPTEVPERYRAASPIELLPLGVPQRIVIGARDPIVPEAFARDYAAAAERAGDDVVLTVLPDAGHFELVVPTSPAFGVVRGAVEELLSR